ncbi:hypothetical protein D3C72_582520 [compost metagenome]
MRAIALSLVAVLALAGPAHAAGVGFSLPKFRALSVGAGASAATSVGGSVQVVGTTFSIRPLKVDVGLDYAYTRNFSGGTNYSFFDINVGAGLPIGLTQQVYLEPAIDTHTLLFVASPEALGSPAFGIGPRLTAGYKATGNISVELSAGYALMLNMTAAGRATGGGLTTIEIGGTYSF